jgi:hypothetical protein
MPNRKGPITLGFERLLNNPQASPLTNPDVYNTLMRTAGQPLSVSLKHIGKKVVKEDKSKQRLEKLEQAHEESK